MSSKKSKKKSARSNHTVYSGFAERVLKALKSWQFWVKITLASVVLFGVAVIYLDAVVRYKFEGKKWVLPGKVYGRALELYSGLTLPEKALQAELKNLGYRSVSVLAGPGTFVKSRPGNYVVHSWGFHFWDGTETAKRFSLVINSNKVELLSAVDKGDLNLVRLEPMQMGGIYPNNYEDRELVRLNEVPTELLAALFSVEDKDFYQHHGVSLRGILRALTANLTSGAVKQGGSTLTQQLVKNFYLTQERSILRKVMEAIMAVLLEVHYEKDEILETYINEIYLGQAGDRAVHGFGLASQHYFKQPLKELKLHQVALLVGLVKGPSYYDPWRHPERALKRRNLIFDLLVQDQLIPQEKIDKAKALPLDVAVRTESLGVKYPGYMDLVRQQLQQDYQDNDLSSEGLRIFTNFDPFIQAESEKSLSDTIVRLEKQYGIKKQALQGSVVVTKTGTGEVAALVSGRDARFAGYNRVLRAVRPIGSLIKPAVYLTALRKPADYGLGTLISDAPVTVKGPDKNWQPANFDHKIHGQVPLYEALAYSYNLATARLGMKVGINRVLDTIKQLGIDKDIAAVPSVLLGATELSPMEVATMYQTIASEGFYTPLRAIREVVDANGNRLKRYPINVEQRFDSQSIYLLLYAMQTAVREGTAKSVYQTIPQNVNVAGKTGTTNDQRDSWFAGLDGRHLAVVWLGRDDNGTTPLTGATGALQVWRSIFAQIGMESISFTKPADIDYHWIDTKSGLLSKETCENARYLPYINGYEPEYEASCIPRADGVGGGVVEWFKKLF